MESHGISARELARLASEAKGKKVNSQSLDKILGGVQHRCHPKLRQALAKVLDLPTAEWLGCEQDLPDLPFGGGWIGFVGYEAGLSIEGLISTARRDVDLPALRFGLYDTAAVFDHLLGQWQVAGVDWPDGGVDRPRLDERLDYLADVLAGAKSSPPDSSKSPQSSCPVANMSPQEYLRSVT